MQINRRDLMKVGLTSLLPHAYAQSRTAGQKQVTIREKPQA